MGHNRAGLEKSSQAPFRRGHYSAEGGARKFKETEYIKQKSKHRYQQDMEVASEKDFRVTVHSTKPTFQT